MISNTIYTHLICNFFAYLNKSKHYLTSIIITYKCIKETNSSKKLFKTLLKYEKKYNIFKYLFMIINLFF